MVLLFVDYYVNMELDKMKRFSLIAFVMLCATMLWACSSVRADDRPRVSANGPIILDIGHHVGAGGACSPDGKISEFNFWCCYVGVIKDELEKAGYRCIVINRGKPVTKEPMASACRKAGVHWLKYPERGGHRYPSRHYPDFIGAGMVSADYAIDQKAICAVFLHLNAAGRGWTTTPPTGLMMCGDKHGRPLAQAVINAMKTKLYDRPEGMPNAGRGCKILVRKGKHEMGAGWLNACDAAGIPAIVTEAVYVNNRGHVDFIRTDAGARMLAKTIASGILDWLKSR